MTPVIPDTARPPVPRPAKLLDPVKAPSLVRSSPHVMTFPDFAATFGGSPQRHRLLVTVEEELRVLRSHGIVAMCLLIGGSFVREVPAPNDLDALVVYRLEPEATSDAIDLMTQRVRDGLDLRFVPGDVGPLPLVKMACFFHTLYQSRDRGGDQASYLVTLAD